jgi:hypothetical protein
LVLKDKAKIKRTLVFQNLSVSHKQRPSAMNSKKQNFATLRGNQHVCN